MSCQTPVSVKTGHEEYLCITEEGKVGIGTGAPERELHVRGHVKIAAPEPEFKPGLPETLEVLGSVKIADGPGGRPVSGRLEISGKWSCLVIRNDGLVISNDQNEPTVRLGGKDASIVAGGEGVNGKVSVRGKDGNPLVELLAFDKEAVIGMGNLGRPGRISVYDTNHRETIQLNGDKGDVWLLGGQLLLNDKQNRLTVRLDPAEAFLGAGGPGRGGQLVLNNTQYRPRIQLDAEDASIVTGGEGVNGKVSVQGKDGNPLVELLAFDKEAVIGLGNLGRPGRISVYDTNHRETIQLNGDEGDVWLFNADCAEDFDIAADGVEPGTVMVLTENGSLTPSSQPYDTCVAGVISGAGNCRPGLVLDKQPATSGRMPLALAGKVYCKVDAQFGAVEVGDLLTTASTPGHAMKASDPARAFGAVIGKALRSLPAGFGLIPIIVALQ